MIEGVSQSVSQQPQLTCCTAPVSNVIATTAATTGNDNAEAGGDAIALHCTANVMNLFPLFSCACYVFLYFGADCCGKPSVGM